MVIVMRSRVLLLMVVVVVIVRCGGRCGNGIRFSSPTLLVQRAIQLLGVFDGFVGVAKLLGAVDAPFHGSESQQCQGGLERRAVEAHERGRKRL